MGQKVHPTGVRLGYIKNWNSQWYADSKDYAETLRTDILARRCIEHELEQAGVSRIEIKRPARNAHITVYVARPGAVIKERGKGIDLLREKVSKIMGVPVHIVISEVRKPDLDAALVSKAVAKQLESRVMFRRAMKRVVTSAMRTGAKGIKISVAGRLNGAEIARTEWYREGRVPLHTLRADIDYAQAEAKTTYGIIGVKVWIYKGEILDKTEQQIENAQGEAA